MGMYDTVYAELDCPFCGRQYRYSPVSWEDAEREVKRHKEWQIKSREKFLRGEKAFYLQDFWAKRDGFDDIDVWIEQLNTPDKIEAYRTARALGLAEIQTKEFECVGEFSLKKHKRRHKINAFKPPSRELALDQFHPALRYALPYAPCLAQGIHRNWSQHGEYEQSRPGE